MLNLIRGNKDQMTTTIPTPTPPSAHRDVLARLRISYFKTLNSEYLNINHLLNKCPNHVVKIYFINKLPERRIGSLINFDSNMKQV